MKPTLERMQSRASFWNHIQARSQIEKAKEEIKQINEYKKRQTKAERAYF